MPWFERAIAIDPDYAPARIRFGELLEKLARFDQARAQLLAARRLDPKNAFAPLGLGRIELNAGRLAAALPLLEAAYALAPETRSVVATLSQAYFRAGQPDRARRLAEEARFLPRKTYRPDQRRAAVRNEAVDLRSYLHRANTLRDVGQLAEARREVETLLAIAPTMAEAQYAAAGIYDRRGSRRWRSRPRRVPSSSSPAIPTSVRSSPATCSSCGGSTRRRQRRARRWPRIRTIPISIWCWR